MRSIPTKRCDAVEVSDLGSKGLARGSLLLSAQVSGEALIRWKPSRSGERLIGATNGFPKRRSPAGFRLTAIRQGGPPGLWRSDEDRWGIFVFQITARKLFQGQTGGGSEKARGDRCTVVRLRRSRSELPVDERHARDQGRAGTASASMFLAGSWLADCRLSRGGRQGFNADLAGSGGRLPCYCARISLGAWETTRTETPSNSPHSLVTRFSPPRQTLRSRRALTVPTRLCAERGQT